MSHIISPPEPLTAKQRPLCADLDGTLVKSDTLLDSLLVLVRTNPASIPGLLRVLPRGKAACKEYVTQHVSLDVVHLPYNRKVLQFLRSERRQGREIYLATGANEALARRVAAHLGLFTDVLGSSAAVNLTGNRKLESLRARLGEFDYIGNDTPDLPLLQSAGEAMVANPSKALRLKLRALGIRPAHCFEERDGTLHSIVSAVRPHQWAKNLLIFLPLLLSHALSATRLLDALLAFCCFSLAASSAYIVNDLLDIEADRRHAMKHLRPFARGELSAVTGLALAAGFLLLAFAGAHLLAAAFNRWLLFYLCSTMAYSWYLKRIALVDVVVLSGLYTLRLFAGAAATGTVISQWLAGFSMFLFFSLAVVKRFAELENLRSSGAPPHNGRGYLVADLDQLRSFGTASAFAAVMVFALYISGSNVTALYRRPQLLWLIMPLMVLWLCRVWLLASRGNLDEDPLVFALTDRMSRLIGVTVAVVVWLAV